MQHSSFERPSRVRQVLLHGFALTALLLGTVAGATTLTISGKPATSVLGWHPYSFTPTTTIPSGYSKTFSISGKPSWASFNTANGTLSGMPQTASVGTSSTVVISVSDGPSKASLPAFTLKVLPNITPTITGTPATTATAGTLYTFTPKASESDGDPLSFSVRNKPSWASFSIATGTLSGTPAAANAGTFSNIVISTSTGHASASLPAFTITVKSSSGGTTGTTGSASLHWTAPTTNTNGSALTNLAGYHIYYGKSASSMTTTITVASPGTTSYTVSNLAAGTWYFAVSAYTSNGTQSARSNVGSKSVP
jgi:hypothetical protein